MTQEGARPAMTTRYAEIEFDLAAFQRAIEQRRTAEQISRRQLMSALGLSHSTYTRIMNGHEPSMRTLARLTAWLGTDSVRAFTTGGRNAG